MGFKPKAQMQPLLQHVNYSMLIISDYRDWYLQVPSPPDQKPFFSS